MSRSCADEHPPGAGRPGQICWVARIKRTLAFRIMEVARRVAHTFAFPSDRVHLRGIANRTDERNRVADGIIGERHGAARLPISILDFAMAGRGLTAREALAASIELARLAARLGFPFAFAAHPADQNVELTLEVYRSNFQPSAVLAQLYVIASFGVMAANDMSCACACVA